MGRISVDRRQEWEGLKECNRLNRLYAKEYRAYKAALAGPDVAAIVKKDRINKVLDEIDALVWYTYHKETGTIRIKRKRIDTLLTKLIEEGANLEGKEVLGINMASREWLLGYVYYDPDRGTFEYNQGKCEGDPLGTVVNAVIKPLRRESKSRVLRSKHYKPKPPAGYCISSEAAYLKSLHDKDGRVHKRHYYIRVKKCEGGVIADRAVPYYLKSLSPSLSIPLHPLKTSLSAVHVAYMLMGAGGEWDYSEGLDRVKKINVECIPQGFKNYSIKTNRPVKAPCRDGNPLNLKWDNIKPYEVGELGYISMSSLIKVPRQVRKPHTKKPTKRTPYSMQRNIKIEECVERGIEYRMYVLKGMGLPHYSTTSKVRIIEEYTRRLNDMQGTKQTLRSGEVMVTVKGK